MSDELKPCPFCGKKNLEYYLDTEGYVISCNECLFNGPVIYKNQTKAQAIKAWNTRIIEKTDR